ncbi:unnamed protein product [Pleuronectes platessa]|uniref:Uncharacterized protein n=1 Tax=Pleuronectes platessa TaxID=8262 RepID=A0A9N7YTM4_PLEPL|nr:unnamed protein product [Pleuronectes platessa]
MATLAACQTSREGPGFGPMRFMLGNVLRRDQALVPIGFMLEKFLRRVFSVGGGWDVSFLELLQNDDETIWRLRVVVAGLARRGKYGKGVGEEEGGGAPWRRK